MNGPIPWEDNHEPPSVHPLWAAFSAIRDQPERMVLANLAWSLNLFPGCAALGFDSLPLPLRGVLLAYSLLVFFPTWAMLYALAAQAFEGQELTLEAATEALRNLTLLSFRSLAPLVLLLVGALVLAVDPFVPFQVLGRLSSLVLLCLASYWGPLFIERPQDSAWKLLIRSLRWFWSRPLASVGFGVLSVLAGLLGVFTIGGFFLILGMLLALWHTGLLRSNRKSV